MANVTFVINVTFYILKDTKHNIYVDKSPLTI